VCVCVCVCVCVSECFKVHKQPPTLTLIRKEDVRIRKKFIHLRRPHFVAEDTGQVCLGTVFCRSVCVAPSVACLYGVSNRLLFIPLLRHDRIIPNVVRFIVR